MQKVMAKVLRKNKMYKKSQNHLRYIYNGNLI